MIELIKFYTYTNNYTTGQTIQSKCNAITFYNSGTNTMVVDGIPFAPQTSIVFQGNVGEYTEQNFNLSFIDIGGVNQATVYRKQYV